MKKSIIKIMSLTIVLSLLLSILSSCRKSENSKPILKVQTSSQLGVTIFGFDKYYIVYDNGVVKKTSKFDISKDIKSYAFNPDAEEKDQPYLHNIDINDEEDCFINEVATEINKLSKSNSIESLGKLYCIKDIFYFSASVLIKKDVYESTLFEYNPSKKELNKIAKFKDNISFVQEYDEN